MIITRVLIGTFTDGSHGDGSGLYFCDVNLATGAFGTPTLAAAARNPSYVIAGTGSRVYATQEHDDVRVPGVVAYRRTATTLLALGGQPVSGTGCCHLAISPDGRFLVSAHYESGDADLFPLASDGTIGSRLATVRGTGHGPHVDRQAGPHAHCIAFRDDPKEVMVVDLGTDAITVFAFDADAPTLDVASACRITLPPGSGPRHLDVAPDGESVAVLCELDETVLFYQRAPDGWHLIDTLQAFDRPADGRGAGAAIRRGANDCLYVSSRTDDLIACLAPAGDGWAVRQRIASGGAHPRDIALSPCGGILLAANRFDDRITSFTIDPGNGTLDATGHAAVVPSPACLLFASPATGRIS